MIPFTYPPGWPVWSGIPIAILLLAAIWWLDSRQPPHDKESITHDHQDQADLRP